ncbi:response regulator, partial [Myceligenerans pegani]
MIRTLLVDDQAVVRAGYRVLLEDAGDIEVVGEASNGPAAIRDAARLRPDVVCMDVRMPGGDGITATRAILAAGAGTDPTGTAPTGTERDDADRDGAVRTPPAILVVTTFDLDDYVFGALEAGASGFLLKDCEPEELITAVRRLAAGEGMVDQAVTRRVITEFARRTRRTAPEPGPAAALTERETEIVRLLASGMSNAEIARELFVETSTVKSHLGRAMTKIGTRDRVQT